MKPENCLIGRGCNSSIIYVIDFGLSTKYIDSATREHIPFKCKGVITGTASYASLNAHLGYECSRRDDLETLGYVLIYLLRGRLPWQGNGKKEYSLEYIKNEKSTNQVKKLCANLPPQFEQYMLYCRNLKFDEKPSYKDLKLLLEACMNDEKMDKDGCMDWQIIKVNN